MRGVGIATLVLALAGPVGAGEILLANGSRIAGELANEVLMVSDGSHLIEVRPEEVVEITPEAIRLKDGRTVRGTVVGGRVKARTPLGELAIEREELRLFRAEGGVASASVSAIPATPPPGPRPEPPTSVGSVLPPQGPAGAAPGPTAAPPRARARVSAPTTPPTGGKSERVVAAAAVREVDPRRRSPRALEVVAAESPLYRDALRTAARVGTVARGEQVTYVDFIDRRLRIFNKLILDGGYWIRVRASDGTVGWLPADALREVQ